MDDRRAAPDLLRDCVVRDLQGRAHPFWGALLGFGSSRLDTHIHAPSQPPVGAIRCSGCRWTEVRIYWQPDQSSPFGPNSTVSALGLYVVGIKGTTQVPGEFHRYKCWWASTAQGALSCLLVTPPPRRARGAVGEKELPVANRLALEQAAELDPAIEVALSDWEALEELARARDEPVVPHPSGLTA